MNPGVYPRLTYAEYAALPGIRAAELHGYGRSPAHARYRQQVPRSSDSLRFGVAVHAAILEPASFYSSYLQERPRATGKGSRAINAQAAAEAKASGLVELEADEYDRVIGCRDAVLSHPIAGGLLLETIATELSILWEDPDTGAACKARLDALTANPLHEEATVVLDLKTARDASYRGFQRAIADYGYHESAAWYLSGLAALEPVSQRRWIWIAVEPDPPHGVAVYEPDFDLLAAGAEANREHLATHLACERSGAWPGYPESVTTIQAPRWMR